MKKTKAILITAIVCAMASVCWGQSYWNKVYGDGYYASAITPTPDGNFIVVGSDYNGDAYFLKIAPNGDMLWAKSYGGTENDEAYAITSTSDGNFIVAGATASFSAGDEEVYILKIKPNGDTLWTKTYGGTGEDYATAIAPTLDGNFIVVGGTNTTVTGYNDVFLLKITPKGDTLWTKTYGGIYNDDASAITPTPDGNFIVVGLASSIDGNSCDVYILKIKPNGDILWTKKYGGTGSDVAWSITPTPDGDFIIAGQTTSFGADSGDIYLLKIKQNGDTIWTKTYGGNGDDGACAIIPTFDGNFIIVGYTTSFSAGYHDVYLLKINPNGDTLWTKKIGGTNFDGATAITPTSDGNFIVAGYTWSFEPTGIWLLSIFDDPYARKDSLFTFKIPVSGDSLSYGYAPIKIPSGMTVSLGGTISWTPKTDSVYMDHAEFLVSDDFGNKDTLIFNIFVNSSYHPTAIKTLSSPIPNKNRAYSIMQTSSSKIKFTLPAGVSSLDIFDIHGRCVQRLKPTGAQAIWNGLSAAGSPVSSGRYFAKIKEGKTSRLGQFTVVR